MANVAHDADGVEAFIGIGSNIEDPHQQVMSAIAHLQKIPHTRLITHSEFYQTAPVGPQDQPDFINAVAILDTTLTAIELLDALQEIERKQLRVRKRHWGPRTLDLDILFYGDAVIETERLTVPHPRMFERDFVLMPLQELLSAGG